VRFFFGILIKTGIEEVGWVLDKGILFLGSTNLWRDFKGTDEELSSIKFYWKLDLVKSYLF